MNEWISPFDNLTPEQQRQAKALMARIFGHGTPYTFHRADGFYPITLQDDDDARANALCNPGTLKVVNELTGEIVWNTTL